MLSDFVVNAIKLGAKYIYVNAIQHDGKTGNILNLVESTSSGTRGLTTPANINLQSSGTYRVTFWVKSNGTNKVALISNRFTNESVKYMTNVARNQSYTAMNQVVNDIIVPDDFVPGKYKFQIN